MKVWQVARDWSIEGMELADLPEPDAWSGPGRGADAGGVAELSRSAHGAGQGRRPRLPLIPFSDGAGEVIAVGDGVTRVAVGDRVCPMFFQSWIDGKVSAASRRYALGGTRPGVLQEVMLLDAEGVSRIPIAPVSSRKRRRCPAPGSPRGARCSRRQVQPGDTVLVQGTGGVSIFALQFAKLAGASVIVTSSSDEKLERAKALGADHTINYRSVPEWGKAAADWTGGGVDHVVEVGGKDTFWAVARGGEGRWHHPGDRRALRLLAADRDPEPVLQESACHRPVRRQPSHVRGDDRGDRPNAMKPVIDRVFGFDAVPGRVAADAAGRPLRQDRGGVSLRVPVRGTHPRPELSLRAQRSNPESLRADSLDCFVAALLAMTAMAGC